MRLDDFDSSINVEDQRGGGGRFPLGGGGKLGCGSIVIALIAAVVFGVDPAQMLGTLEQVQNQAPAQQQQQGGTSLAESCSANEFSRESCNALSSLNKTWTPLFAQANIPFETPKLVFYSQNGNSGCGAAQSAMGPFYCPADQGIYIDTDFYTQMDQQMGAGGDFARVYVMAHEYGHHIQNVLGTSTQMRQMQQRSPSQANRLSVALELQADCYAGVWAGRNRDRIEAGDIEEGMRAAHQIGDDTLMKAAGRRPVEEGFTHGSSAQRMEWLRRGLETADEDQCDTFKAL
ncbi:zinc metalloprotease [Novosphingobium sp. ERN07]|uniref:KPN_02809 family neutral zinc metallopeptidase n=1 Tax=Novosphingobium sp. ERN07 TaxID=2726187 RepID=UPI00145690DE|nr:neutral zinc metallopeptidase [Novosphingobium sp. ERN07]NLR72356.1 zinc metalloprotease [Novosphingobium sp. ERN07]